MTPLLSLSRTLGRSGRALGVRGPIEGPTMRAAAISAALLVGLALAGASVRVLPWLLDPRVPWRVAIPFGRAVASVAVEAGVLVGWPIGWTFSALALCDLGEARVLESLGVRPLRTVARLVPTAVLFGALVGGAALAGGKDASEPGRILLRPPPRRKHLLPRQQRAARLRRPAHRRDVALQRRLASPAPRRPPSALPQLRRLRRRPLLRSLR